MAAAGTPAAGEAAREHTLRSDRHRQLAGWSHPDSDTAVADIGAPAAAAPVAHTGAAVVAADIVAAGVAGHTAAGLALDNSADSGLHWFVEPEQSTPAPAR
jgi:hypothetical protein